MEVRKQLQLTEEEFRGIKQTSLYERLISNKYDVVGDEYNCEHIAEGLSKKATAPWYIATSFASSNQMVYAVYVSCSKGINHLNGYAQVPDIE